MKRIKKLTVRYLTGLTLFCLALFPATLLFGQSAEQHPEWPGKGQLFVGTC